MRTVGGTVGRRPGARAGRSDGRSDGGSSARTLVSVPWTWAFGAPPDPADAGRTSVLTRRVDWGRRRSAARLGQLVDALRVARASRDHDAVVLATVGVEAALTSRLVRVANRRARVVVLDVLAPRRELSARVARRLFTAVDAFLVIRRGDTAMLGRRFAVAPDRCRFVPWPVPVRAAGEESAAGPDDRDGRPPPGRYVYAAGWAHRDWPTLLAALARTDVTAVLAPGHPLEVPEPLRDRVRVVDMPAPEVGRALTVRAAAVVVAMRDTDLPSGPLVLLDALAAGRPVVASDVNGTRDYVRDGVTALVVPPGDPTALATALARVWTDAALAERLGTAAAAYAAAELGTDAFWAAVLEAAAPRGAAGSGQARPGRGSRPTLS